MTSRAGWAAQSLSFVTNIIVISFKNFAEQHDRVYVKQVRAGGPQAGANSAPFSPIYQELYPVNCLLQKPAAAYGSLVVCQEAPQVQLYMW